MDEIEKLKESIKKTHSSFDKTKILIQIGNDKSYLFLIAKFSS